MQLILKYSESTLWYFEIIRYWLIFAMAVICLIKQVIIFNKLLVDEIKSLMK